MFEEKKSVLGREGKKITGALIFKLKQATWFQVFPFFQLRVQYQKIYKQIKSVR
jgi:hypothetical protein